MPIRPVLTWPDERLKAIATPVALVDDDVRQLISDLFETMYDEQGVGLAATQVGVAQRVVVLDCEQDAGGRPLALVNGEIVERDGTVIWREGCLSLPGVTAEVERSARIVVQYLDESGVSQRLQAEGLTAVCIQHELDHLDGQLYIDRLGLLERKSTINDYDDFRSKNVLEPVL